MSQLKLDPVFMVLSDPHWRLADFDQLFIGPCARKTSEAMNSLPTVIAETIQTIDHGVFG
ncbi:hypothetical protein AN936_13455 [Sphingopyxis macrogoltabida]|uniref:Uncharacterized protein n=1 Tax=Sphingopyxis macrogoltabida TaxID=33050 RepID=A0A0N9UYK2_SPHMC|nr:hypothetical protein AN936_13455 [Sphingopyxis macrogoltabida]